MTLTHVTWWNDLERRGPCVRDAHGGIHLKHMTLAQRALPC